MLARTDCERSWRIHPGIAGLLKTRDPFGPHSLAEAFLAPLRAAGLPDRETGRAFSRIYDYTLGFAFSSPTSVNEQRVQDTETTSDGTFAHDRGQPPIWNGQFIRFSVHNACDQ
jgi:hypothetical protein